MALVDSCSDKIMTTALPLYTLFSSMKVSFLLCAFDVHHESMFLVVTVGCHMTHISDMIYVHLYEQKFIYVEQFLDAIVSTHDGREFSH